MRIKGKLILILLGCALICLVALPSEQIAPVDNKENPTEIIACYPEHSATSLPTPTPIPESTLYYNATSDIFYTKPIVGTWFEQLQMDIDSAPYDVDDYRIHVFDCSNMAALLHDWLEERGWNVEIYIGENDKGTHAWLLVNRTWVEPMWKGLAYDRPYTTEFEKIKAYESPERIIRYGLDEVTYTIRNDEVID